MKKNTCFLYLMANLKTNECHTMNIQCEVILQLASNIHSLKSVLCYSIHVIEALWYAHFNSKEHLTVSVTDLILF